MSTGAILQLAFQGVVFAGWAVLMFRTMFLFRKRDLHQSGRMFHGPTGFVKQAEYWLRSEEDKRDRRLLLVFTLLLFASIALNALRITA
ncbi:hypothetical protein HKCCE4037_05555 [Rhodobacterales bacterium HKCCE4037]|nr:hypothetical protein [Rhodobacterales bacterium HKCCE4037]